MEEREAKREALPGQLVQVDFQNPASGDKAREKGAEHGDDEAIFDREGVLEWLTDLRDEIETGRIEGALEAIGGAIKLLGGTTRT